jgi:hypothetical protein
MARRGANKLKAKAYRDSKVREYNKRRKLNNHLKSNPSDNDALKALKTVA